MIARIIQLAAVLLAVWSGPALAQAFTVTSVTGGNFGNVASASTGQSTFRASASGGSVSKQSGNAVRISTQSVRTLVTISCDSQAACATSNAALTITRTGTASGRAGSLTNFTISTSGATATIAVGPASGSSISFQLNPIGQSSSKTFYVGYDLPIMGNDSAAATGPASSAILVTVTRTDGSNGNSLSGLVTANVFRPIAIAHSTNLNFGRIIRPSTGSGTVTLANATGAVSVTGTGAIALGGISTSAALFAITGEGGQSVSVSVPGSFTMTGPAGNLSVTTSASASGSQVLSGAIGAAGALSVKVGGSVALSSTTPSGSYSGSLTVTVQYN